MVSGRNFWSPFIQEEVPALLRVPKPAQSWQRFHQILLCSQILPAAGKLGDETKGMKCGFGKDGENSDWKGGKLKRRRGKTSLGASQAHPEPLPRLGGSQGKRGCIPQMILGNVLRLGQPGAQRHVWGMQLGSKRRGRRRLRNICTPKLQSGFWLEADQGCLASPRLTDGGP